MVASASHTRAVAETTVVRPGFSGAVGAGLSLGVAELIAGLFESVPSAVSAIGSVVVDVVPGSIERAAIDVFGSADKGALAVGTTIIALIIGAIVGRAAVKRRWLTAAMFSVFSVLGVLAGWAQPGAGTLATALGIGFAGFFGWWVADRFIHPSNLDPTDALPESNSRRRFLQTSAAAGVAVASGAAGRSLIINRSETVRENVSLGTAVNTAPPVLPENSLMAPNLTPIVVPNGDFYRIDTALIVPRPNVDTWTMRVTGMVENELEFSLQDLMNRDLHERYVTISCVSNEVGGRLVGNAKWTGVRLSEVLEEAGVLPGATQIVGRSVDRWTAGFPTEAVFDGRDPLIAIGMNDEPLPPRHGFPARLIVPGLYGYVSATKWLDEIELTTWDAFDGYWVPKGWAKAGTIKTQSRIDHPKNGDRIDGNPAVIAGIAWAPTRGISKVEIQVNDGEWIEVERSAPLSDESWVQWRAEVALPPAEFHQVMVRATDGSGATQTSTRTGVKPDGATGHHHVRFGTL
jgi:DMSO/TMAO reductase YedYZ molybdopterin-dependent catalytic subunit